MVNSATDYLKEVSNKKLTLLLTFRQCGLVKYNITALRKFSILAASLQADFRCEDWTPSLTRRLKTTCFIENRLKENNASVTKPCSVNTCFLAGRKIILFWYEGCVCLQTIDHTLKNKYHANKLNTERRQIVHRSGVTPPCFCDTVRSTLCGTLCQYIWNLLWSQRWTKGHIFQLLQWLFESQWSFVTTLHLPALHIVSDWPAYMNMYT